MHVRTMDCSIIRHNGLRAEMQKGLNHIPLRPTSISCAIDVIMQAFADFISVLQQLGHHFPEEWIEESTATICEMAWEQLMKTCATKKHTQVHGPYIFDIEQVNEEVTWLQKHLYMARLDKAANTPCFVCISLIRVEALKCLSSPDFATVQESPESILLDMQEQITKLLPELTIDNEAALPYLMATYKQHKKKYRWLTNGHDCVFSILADLLTVATNALLLMLKHWAADKQNVFERFLNVHTSMYWIADSTLDVSLNLPLKLNDVFVADIARCYEAIPTDDPDSLVTAISACVQTAYKQCNKGKRNSQVMFVRYDIVRACFTKARWAARFPEGKQSIYTELSAERLIQLHCWLLHNCFVQLGDKVWRQVAGIPMGFACSPLWCNLYFHHYEAAFILGLAKLGRADLMAKFRYAKRYMDDVCWMNTGTPMQFLNPDSPRTDDDPFWIYPLNVVSMEVEIQKYDINNEGQQVGTDAHFLSFQFSITNLQQGKFKFTKYDNRRALPFQIVQFIHLQSNRQIKQAYKVILSQVFIIPYVCNSVNAAFLELDILIKAFVANGFDKLRLLKGIQFYLETNFFPGAHVSIELLVARVALEIKAMRADGLHRANKNRITPAKRHMGDLIHLHL